MSNFFLVSKRNVFSFSNSSPKCRFGFRFANVGVLYRFLFSVVSSRSHRRQSFHRFLELSRNVHNYTLQALQLRSRFAPRSSCPRTYKETFQTPFSKKDSRQSDRSKTKYFRVKNHLGLFRKAAFRSVVSQNQVHG